MQQQIEELSRQANVVSKSIGTAKDDTEREARKEEGRTCLLYTSDAADDLLCVDLGGRRILTKKNHTYCTTVTS